MLNVVLKGDWTMLGNLTLVPGDRWIVGATIAWARYLLLYLKPRYAAVIAWLVLGEALHLNHAWAMSMVLPGTYPVNRKRGG